MKKTTAETINFVLCVASLVFVLFVLSGCAGFVDRIGVEPGEKSAVCGRIHVDPSFTESGADYVIVEFPDTAVVSSETYAKALENCADL